MRKTLLLVFIHGFKGGDDTFGPFPEHLRALISHALPQIDVVAITYPKFETRGELKDCVERFREWLQNKVIDLEVAHSTPSPTIDPSVHTILIGHSMGGIVAAETLLLLAKEEPLPSPTSGPEPLPESTFASNTTLRSTTSTSHPPPNHPLSSAAPDNEDALNTTTMFPRIVGLLAFDTPFLGISPGVIAHGAEGHYKTASTAYNAFSELGSAFGWGAGTPKSPASPKQPPAGLLTSGAADAAAAPKWQSWGKYAMFAGAAGAVAAGGAAALYTQREKISSGWGWVGSHLEFVGVLLRGEECRGRVERVGALSKHPASNWDTGRVGHGPFAAGVGASSPGSGGFGGSAVFYTMLGRGANNDELGSSVLVDGMMAKNKRTFCKLPSHLTPDAKGRIKPEQQQQKSIHEESPSLDLTRQKGLRWIPAVNDKAADEITAHTSIFFPRDNPGFYGLGERAKEVVIGWIDREWYEESTPDVAADAGGAAEGTKSGGEGWGRDAAEEPNFSGFGSEGGKTYGEVGDDGWEKPDYDDEAVKAKQREKREGPGSGLTEAEAVWIHEGEGDDEGDVRMRDESEEAVESERSDLESSVVVDKT